MVMIMSNDSARVLELESGFDIILFGNAKKKVDHAKKIIPSGDLLREMFMGDVILLKISTYCYILFMS